MRLKKALELAWCLRVICHLRPVLQPIPRIPLFFSSSSSSSPSPLYPLHSHSSSVSARDIHCERHSDDSTEPFQQSERNTPIQISFRPIIADAASVLHLMIVGYWDQRIRASSDGSSITQDILGVQHGKHELGGIPRGGVAACRRQ